MIVSIMRGFLGACAAITSGLAVCYVLLQAPVACILIRCSFNGGCLLLLAGPLFSALHLISPMSCDNQRRGQPSPARVLNREQRPRLHPPFAALPAPPFISAERRR